MRCDLATGYHARLNTRVDAIGPYAVLTRLPGAELSFVGKEKGLAVNKTNANIIAQNVGSDDLDDWIGREIILYPTRVDFGGQMVDAIRVKEQIPEVADGPDDEIPF